MKKFNYKKQEILEGFYPLLMAPGEDRVPVKILPKNNGKITVYFGSAYTWANCEPRELIKFANSLFNEIKNIERNR